MLWCNDTVSDMPVCLMYVHVRSTLHALVLCGVTARHATTVSPISFLFTIVPLLSRVAVGSLHHTPKFDAVLEHSLHCQFDCSSPSPSPPVSSLCLCRQTPLSLSLALSLCLAHTHSRALSFSRIYPAVQALLAVVNDVPNSLCTLPDFLFVLGFLSVRFIPSQQVTGCSAEGCTKVFSFLVRKHHCRRCGDVFCDPHSNISIPILRMMYVHTSCLCCPARSGACDESHGDIETCASALCL